MGYLMNQQEIENLAKAIVGEVQKTHHEFWIDPEQHYIAHKDLSDMLSDYKTAKGIFWKVFVSAVAVAGIIAAGWAVIFGGKKF